MRISIAQVQSHRGNIEANIGHHIKWINAAVAEQADLVVFPELSLTGYEPALAKSLATDLKDERLKIFQRMSSAERITISLGMPTKSSRGIHISMAIFQPDLPPTSYSKQMLHSDELPFFTRGEKQVILTIGETHIAPAICYESLQKEHAKNAKILDADIYMASVAKPQEGIQKALLHFPMMARTYSMPVLMCNSIGHCDGFQSSGQSAIWDSKGRMLEQLGKDREGLLFYDTISKRVNLK